VRPLWLVAFVDESTSDALKEVRSFHKSLADSKVIDKALLSSHVSRHLDVFEGHMSRYRTLLFNRLFNLSIKGVLILTQFGCHLLKGLAVKYISDVLFVFNNALSGGLVIPV